LGYTGGKITAIDQSAVNGGRRDVETLDARFTWTLELPMGALRLYGEGVYNLRNKQKYLYEAPVDINGYSDGPLVWRANGGVEWLLESLTLGANLQHYPSYRVGYSFSPGPDILTRFQGSERIPDQSYLDLRLQKRFQTLLGAPLRDLKLDLGVSNVLDTAPPRVVSLTSLGQGYSPYGDPRRRRFELTLSASF
jgi:outer membrane receptor protein involved in Fe transport